MAMLISTKHRETLFEVRNLTPLHIPVSPAEYIVPEDLWFQKDTSLFNHDNFKTGKQNLDKYKCHNLKIYKGYPDKIHKSISFGLSCPGFIYSDVKL